MPKLRTLTEFQDFLDRELSWRVQEISAFRINNSTVKARQKYYVRAGITLLYAHWEGFIKKSAEAYINYVFTQRKSNSELITCFSVLSMKGNLEKLSSSNKYSQLIESFEFIIDKLEERASISGSYSIDTGSNLSSSIFENISDNIGVDSSKYKSHFNLIDESLLSRRNGIAHGEFLDIDFPEFKVLSDEILILMRQFKTDLENAASTQAFLRAPALAPPLASP